MCNLQVGLPLLRKRTVKANSCQPTPVPAGDSAHTARALRTQVTHLFRDVLHGWGQLLLCVNVSPTARDYDETARVLRYAAVAAQVGTAARAQPPLRPLRRGVRALFGIDC